MNKTNEEIKEDATISAQAGVEDELENVVGGGQECGGHNCDQQATKHFLECARLSVSPDKSESRWEAKGCDSFGAFGSELV